MLLYNNTRRRLRRFAGLSLSSNEGEAMDGDGNNGLKTAGRGQGGRFAPGNAGRPRGARHKTTVAIQALLASEAALERFADLIAGLLRRPLALRDGMRNELAPPLVPMDGDARAQLQDFAMMLEREQAHGGKFHPIRPFASKGAEQAARIAAVLAICAAPDAPRVTARIMDGATRLAAHALGEALRLSDAAAISQETNEAEQLRRWLVEKWPEDCISASVAASRGCFKETEKNRRILAFLQRHGWVHLAEGGAMILGKHRREAWRINRGSGV